MLSCDSGPVGNFMRSSLRKSDGGHFYNDNDAMGKGGEITQSVFTALLFIVNRGTSHMLSKHQARFIPSLVGPS